MSTELLTPEQVHEEKKMTTADLVNQPHPPHLPSTHNDEARNEPLVPTDECNRFRDRWHDIQGSFVDEPRRAVEQADELVASAIKRIAEVFAAERSKLEG